MLRLLVVWLGEAWLQGLTSSLESSDMEVRGAGPQGWRCNSLGLSCLHRWHSASLQERKWLFISFICQQFAVTTHHSPWKCFWLATTWEDEVVRLIKPAGDLRQGKHPASGLPCHYLGSAPFRPSFPFFFLIHRVFSQPLAASLVMFSQTKLSLCHHQVLVLNFVVLSLHAFCFEQMQRDFGFSSSFSSPFPFVLFIILKQQLRHQPELFLCCTGNKPITLSLPYNQIIEAWCHFGFHAEQPPDSNFPRPQPDNQPECQLSKVPEIESDKAIISLSLSVLYHFLPLNCS